MNSTQLRTLSTIAELGSFTKAADALGQSQPAVSKAIRLLEEAIGAPLLVRGADGVTPTALGSEVLSHARIVIRELDALRQLTAGQAVDLQGVLRIATPASLNTWPLPKIIAALRKRHPRVTCRVFEGSPEEIRSWLRDHVVEVGLSTGHAPGWSFTPLVEEPFVAVLSNDARPVADAVDMRWLSSQPIISSSCGIEQILRDAFLAEGLALDVAFVTRSYSTIFEMVLEGLGSSIVPKSIAERAPSNLRIVPINGGPSRTIGVLRPEGRSRLVEAFSMEAAGLIPRSQQ